ncbi:MAG: PilN domain-containing protein [Dehalococcoidia bacterium]
MASARRPEQPLRPMLIDINLAPTEVRRPPISISLFSVTLVILALVGGYLLFPFTTFAQLYRWPDIPNLYQVVTAWQDYVSDQKTMLSARQTELDRLMGLAGQAADLRSQIDERETRLNAMDQDYPVFSQGVMEWSTVLKKIDQVAPSGIAILSITQGSEVTIEGIAETGNDIWSYASRLAETELFSRVEVTEAIFVPPASPTPTPTPAPTPAPAPLPTGWSFIITVTLTGGSQ